MKKSIPCCLFTSKSRHIWNELMVLDLFLFLSWFRWEDFHWWLYLSQKQWFEVKNALMGSFITNILLFALQDVKYWTGVTVDYYDIFISCLDSHSGGTHSLQRIHWWAMMSCYFSPNLFRWRNKLSWPEGEYIFSKKIKLFLLKINK